MAKIDILEDEIQRLNKWIADLQTGIYINCVYCGHRYPPGTPNVRDEVLYKHIKQCSKHPLSQVIRLLKIVFSVDSSVKEHAETQEKLRKFIR